MVFLVADDDPTLRMLMLELLQDEWDCKVLEAANGVEAWQILDSGVVPDLCILDLRMPKMVGLELVAKLHSDSRFQKQKIMICSTENDRHTILQAVSLGVNAYLLKPFQATEFIAHVRRHCGAPPADLPPAPLELLPVALKRLRIGRKKYLELLELLTKDVTDFIAELITLSVRVDPADVKLRLGAIRGASLTLGAVPLAATIARLENGISAAEESSILVDIAAVETETERVIAAIARIAGEKVFAK